eukprot:6639667-Prymnesium_polylepis.1
MLRRALPSARVRLASCLMCAAGVLPLRVGIAARRFGGYGRFDRFCRFGLLRLLSLSKSILRVSKLTHFVYHLVYRPELPQYRIHPFGYRRSSDGRVLNSGGHTQARDLSQRRGCGECGPWPMLRHKAVPGCYEAREVPLA